MNCKYCNDELIKSEEDNGFHIMYKFSCDACRTSFTTFVGRDRSYDCYEIFYDDWRAVYYQHSFSLYKERPAGQNNPHHWELVITLKSHPNITPINFKEKLQTLLVFM